ncbi:hypothetical protein PP1_023725 [Pseudonocardia sp. P1]
MEVMTLRDTATVLAAGIAAAGATWYLVGDRSSAGAFPDDRIVAPPPPLPPVAGHVAGIGVLVLLGVLLVAIVRRRRETGPAVPGATALLVVAGVLAGLSWRVVTAATIGANIGGGLALMIVLPLAGILVLVAVGVLVAGAVRRRRPRAVAGPE